jgi:hypothetical protein
MSHATGFVFLDIDDQFGLGQAGLQAGVLLTQLDQFLGQWVGWLWFGTTWLGRESLELTSRTQAAPFDEMRRVQAFAPK